MPFDQNDDIAQAIATARQPDLVYDSDPIAPTASEKSYAEGVNLHDYLVNLPSYMMQNAQRPQTISPANLAKTRYTPQGKAESLQSTIDAAKTMAEPMVKAVTAPGRVFRGEVPEDQMIGEATNMAGQIMGGSFAAAAPSILKHGVDPNQLNMFFGINSKTADRTALSAAQHAESLGIHPDTIWQSTGWGRDPIGNWFYEVPDDKVSVRALRDENGQLIGRESSLRDQVDAPDIYDAYPHTKNITFEHGFMPNGNGYYIRPNNGSLEKIGVGKDQSRATTLHEIQHAIQDYEGWPRGGNPNDVTLHSITSDMRRRGNENLTQYQGKINNFAQEYADALGLAPNDPKRIRVFRDARTLYTIKHPEEEQAIKDATNMASAFNAADIYPFLSGEIQANRTEMSRDWNAADRRKVAPWNRGKYPLYENQVIRHGNNAPFFPDQYAEGGAVRQGYATIGGTPLPEDDQIEKAIATAKTPDTSNLPGAVVRPYEPTWRDRIASYLVGGDAPSFEREHFVKGLVGSTGMGNTGMSVSDLTPIGQAFGAQEAAREGDYKGAAMAVLPMGGALGHELQSIESAGLNAAKRALMRSSEKQTKLPIDLIPELPNNRNTQVFPQLQERYPLTAPPVDAVDKNSGKPYLAKQLSDEALAVQKARLNVQKDIDEGNYNPYFKLSERADVDPSNYPEFVPTTNILKAKPETRAKYDELASTPDVGKRFGAAFQKGLEQKENSENWYFMKQLEDEFVKEYGPKEGRKQFKEKFADAMAATTGGADPTANLLMAHYGNYLKNQGIKEFPPTYALPYPIGGQYAKGNLDQYRKMLMEEAGVTPANPKRYNFSNNFLGNKGATIDEQMSDIFQQGMGMPPAGTYGHYENALNNFAQKAGAPDPRYFQEVAWAGEKDAKTKGGYKSKPMIGFVNEAIERTSRLTGMPPEEVVRRGLVRSEIPLYGAAGFAALNGLNSSSNESEPNFNRGGRTLGNNAIDNAIRMATGGNAEIEMPHSLKELQDWKKNHSHKASSSMDDIFTHKMSGVEGADPIAMPANLDELLAYLRKHHSVGGRAHFGFGGESEFSGSRPESGGSGSFSAGRDNDIGSHESLNAAEGRYSPADRETSYTGNGGGNYNFDGIGVGNQQPSAEQQSGMMGRGAGEGNGLEAAIGLPGGGMFGFAPRFDVGNSRTKIQNQPEDPENIQEYTAQRMNGMYAGKPTNTPYQGTYLTASMDPSTAFGMGYPSLAGVQNTRAGGAGFLGSGMGESGKGLDPSAINGGSIGMFQHTGPRAVALRDTLGIGQNVKGNELRDALAGTGLAQLGFALNEVQTKPDYALTKSAMARGTNAANVADVSLENFERPSLENQIKSAPSREAYAQGIMAGRPSGATMREGTYDVAPSSFADALKSGVNLANTQKSRFADIGSTLANSSQTDASNDPVITAARGSNGFFVPGEGEDAPSFNPYAGFSSEDPALIAAYNAATGANGPKNAYADMVLGQRAPSVVDANGNISRIQSIGNALTDFFTPSYGINSPEYNKISQAIDVAREPSQGRNGQEIIKPPVMSAYQPQATAAVAPYISQLGTYNAQLPSTTGETAEQWAAANTNGDMSKVNGRIKYVNGAPRLEYYAA